MRTIEKTVYKYSELAKEARQKARDRFAEHNGFDRSGEYMASIEALARHFGVSIVDYSLDWTNGCSPSSMEFRAPDEEMTAAEIAKRLRALGTFNRLTKKGNGDCKLTGYGTDESAIDGFRIAWYKGERDLNALMQAAYRTWIAGAWADYEYDYSDEGFADTADANEWEYYEDGTRFRK